MRRKLSCFVIVCNEADRVEACLKSVASWVDQLVILDSGSTDGTFELCQRYSTEVFSTDWPGFGAQRNRALEKCRHDWVLNIDADEEVSPALRQEIESFLAGPPSDLTLVKFPWRTLLFGRPLRFGRYSTPQGKLFLKTGASFKQRSVHESLVLPKEKSMTTRQPLTHHSWRSYRHLIDKHTSYAVLSAQDKFDAGKKASLFYAFLRLFTDFTHQAVFRLGILDGWRGLHMAGALAQYAFHKYACLWSLCQRDDVKTTGLD